MTSTSTTGEKRHEARVSRRRRRSYRSLYENTPVMMHSIDQDGRLVAVSNRWLEVLDYERSEVIGRRSTDFLTPSSRRYAFEVALPAFFEKGKAEGVHYQMVKKDGEVLSVSLSATAELDEGGGVVSSHCYIVDITELKRAEETLRVTRESEERYRRLVEQDADAFFLTERDGRIIDVNQTACESLGYTREELLTLSLRDIALEMDAKTVSRVIESTEPGAPITREGFHRRKNGTTFLIEARGGLIELDGHRLAFAMVRDITARKGAESALREREEEAGRLARENAVIAEIGRIISSSLEIHRVYEGFAEQVRQLTPFDQITISEVDFEARTLTPAYVAGFQVAGWEQGKTHPLSHSRLEPVVYERACLLFDDKSTEQHAQQNPETAAGAHAGLRSGVAVPLISRGQVVGALNLSSLQANAYAERDLHLVERVAAQIAGAISNSQLYAAYRRAEGRRRELAVVEERNRLAREIHDTLAQSLIGITIQLDMAGKLLDHEPETARSEIESARELALHSLEEARRSVWDLHPAQRGPAGLNEALRREVGTTTEHGVQISLEVDGHEPQSIDARNELAALRITQEALSNVRRHSNAKTATVRLTYGASDMRILVSDDGVGFEPFQGERALLPTEGGFGLIGMRERAWLAGGDMEIRSATGLGTEIDARIPYRVSPEERPIANRTSADAGLTQAGASRDIRVLIVDDHEMVRRGIRGVLEQSEGLVVVGEAADGEEAIEQIQAVAPDVVLLDIQMPKLDGVETLKRLRELGVLTPVILLSVYTKDEYIFEGLRAGARGYLLKDIAGDELVSAIQRVHEGGSLLQPLIARRLIERLDPGADSRLTQRELEVLQLLALGKRYRDIAEELSVSVNTIKSHTESLYESLGAHNRTQAIRSARERGILNA